MSHSITFDAKDKFINIKMTGEVNLLSVVEIASEVARIVKEHDCSLIFNDAREATIKLSTLEIYQLPKVFSEILSEKGVQVNKLKRALVVSEAINDMHFFETVSINRGQNMMLFRNLQEAKNWLFEK